jgi:DNA adenine methylase
MAQSLKEIELTYEILDLQLLKPNTKNPNKMDAKTYQLLVKNIRREGFKDPILVVRDAEGYIIVDGHHRKKALQDLGFTWGPCVIAENADINNVTLSTLMLNKIKGRLDPSKVGAILMGLREEYSSKDLVDITGYSSQDLENYASILTIPELPDLAKFTSLCFFRYPGGKFRSRHKLLSVIPSHRVFVEVFGGAGHVVLNKPLTKDVIDVYNDLDSRLVSLFEVVRSRVQEFKERFNGLVYSRELFEKFRKETTVEGDPVESALRFYYLLRSGFAGDPQSSWGYSRENDHARSFWNGLEDLELIWKRLQTVHIDHLDFRECIRKWDSAETVFFVDPPYYGINYYRETFSERDHEDLYKLLCGAVVGKWLLTYNNHSWVREKYKGHEFRLASSPLSMSHERGLGSREMYHNLVIMNFNPEEAKIAEAFTS